MNSIIKEIGQFIFVENIPEKADAIMVVGGSHPELGEKVKFIFTISLFYIRSFIYSIAIRSLMSN